MMRNATCWIIAGVYGVQAIVVMGTMSLGTACPAWLNINAGFIAIYLLPLIGIIWHVHRMKTWRDRILTLLLVPVGSLVVLIIFGVLGAAMSLFLFGTFSMEGIQ